MKTKIQTQGQKETDQATRQRAMGKPRWVFVFSGPLRYGLWVHAGAVPILRVGVTVVDCCQPSYRAPLSERVVVGLRNLWHWRTAWAVKHLSQQLQRDLGFRESWQANIAMPIYDATRSAETLSKHDCGWKSHMEGTQANYIADRLMKHLFGA